MIIHRGRLIQSASSPLIQKQSNIKHVQFHVSVLNWSIKYLSDKSHMKMTRFEPKCEMKSNAVLCPQLKISHQVIDTTLNRQYCTHCDYSIHHDGPFRSLIDWTCHTSLSFTVTTRLVITTLTDIDEAKSHLERYNQETNGNHFDI